MRQSLQYNYKVTHSLDVSSEVRVIPEYISKQRTVSSPLSWWGTPYPLSLMNIDLMFTLE